MKKLLALALAAAMSLSLAACGGGSTSTPAASSPAASGSGSDVSAPTGGDSSDFKVGAIYITSQNDVAGYTFQHHNGITTAMKDLGMDPATQLLIVDKVDEDYDAVCSAIDTLANQGANVIFGISFGYIDAMNDKAGDYPEAGIAAGLKSLETGNNSIGYVAAYNTEYAETCSGINGFTLGVQSANPDATVYVKKINIWGNENLERQAAQALIDTYNCGVISQHCDSAQPQLVAQENNAFGCGYNSDMTEQAPNAHITAAIWHWNVYYQTAIEAAMACNGDASKFVENMDGNAYYAGLAEGLVDTSPVNEATAAPNTTAVMDAVRELIKSGEWDVFTGVKLSYNIGEDGSVEIVKTEADLVDTNGTVIVPAGGPSVDDGVIKGSMDYNVAGVVEG